MSHPGTTLRVTRLRKTFGGILAVNDVSFEVTRNEITAIIGPNGAGKTTVFNLITGFLRPTRGKVLFDGHDITGRKPHLIAETGIGRTFQLAYLFPDFTVLENVVASFYLYPRSGLWEALFNTPAYRRKEKYILNQARDVLRLVGLDKVENELAKNLPHGHQKVLNVARALAIKPKLLLLDEPIAGMTRDEIIFSLGVFDKIRSQGITILFVEHNMEFMSLCDRVIVLNFGNKIAEGSSGEVRQNEAVIQAYFGSEHAA